jgi:hypothetical protein
MDISLTGEAKVGNQINNQRSKVILTSYSSDPKKNYPNFQKWAYEEQPKQKGKLMQEKHYHVILDVGWITCFYK